MTIRVFTDGHLTHDNLTFRCALGRSGIRAEKHEGDGVTPVGTFPLRRLHVRADRMTLPKTGLPTRVIRPLDGWCDDPQHPAYNTLITLPFTASREVMWREDNVYDLIVEIGYNDAPPIAGAGSAIFMHVAKPDFAPTEGCVALNAEDLKKLLVTCTATTEIEIIGDT
jgi:L,D-peptidoglycan transpeptidase YkuD (ErfK/YbiS/YcfS/YnhG family)